MKALKIPLDLFMVHDLQDGFLHSWIITKKEQSEESAYWTLGIIFSAAKVRHDFWQ